MLARKEAEAGIGNFSCGSPVAALRNLSGLWKLEWKDEWNQNGQGHGIKEWIRDAVQKKIAIEKP